MKKTLAALFLATVLLSFSSCKKDKGDDNNNGPRTAREFMAKHGPQLQTVSFNTSELPKTIVLRGGIRITIPQNAFTRGGSPVTGVVTFNALEFFKRSDLLFGGSNTNHISGAPLETQGSFFLEATQNGVALDRQLAQPLGISVPAENNGDLTVLWEGQIGGGRPFASKEDKWKYARSTKPLPSISVSSAGSTAMFSILTQAPKPPLRLM